MPLKEGSRVTSASISRPAPATTFPLFRTLPPELRLKIWTYTIPSHRFVNIRWCPRTRSFKPIGLNQHPPTLLHTCHESRTLGLKTYELAFASSPEFARVYFSFELDALYVDWKSVGSSPGRLGRKMSERDCSRVKSLLINEVFLLEHAEDRCRELARFTSLESIAVICDPLDPESGDQFGSEEIMEFANMIDEGLEEGDLEGRTERWPELVCLRDDDEEEEACSRHWWFDGWNQRSMFKQREPWHRSLAHCLLITAEDDGDADFFLDMLLMQAMGYGQT
jgi:hypothetical protein